MRIEAMCEEWLERNFRIAPKIECLNILPQKEIDKSLGLVGVEFEFTYENNIEGNSTAFFEFDEIFKTPEIVVEKSEGLKEEAIQIARA
jgi:hypothetical protein